MTKLKSIHQGDILAYRGNDNLYKTLLCISVNKDKSPHNFTFAALEINQEKKPSIIDICNSRFWGIGNSRNDYFKYQESELEKMWVVHPEIKPSFLGAYGFIIWRKDFMKFRDEFELIGNINIVNNLNLNGGGSMNASDWPLLKGLFNEDFKNKLKERGQNLFQVKAIII